MNLATREVIKVLFLVHEVILVYLDVLVLVWVEIRGRKSPVLMNWFLGLARSSRPSRSTGHSQISWTWCKLDSIFCEMNSIYLVYFRVHVGQKVIPVIPAHLADQTMVTKVTTFVLKDHLNFFFFLLIFQVNVVTQVWKSPLIEIQFKTHLLFFRWQCSHINSRSGSISTFTRYAIFFFDESRNKGKSKDHRP